MPYSYKFGDQDDRFPRLMTPYEELPNSTPYSLVISMNSQDGYKHAIRDGFKIVKD